MRYELSDHEWTAIKPMLPNKPLCVRRVNDRHALKGPPARSMGDDSAETKSQTPDLL